MINSEGKRALAHIEKVVSIRPIEGADNIEMIGILGWNCIAKKGEFKEGDLAVYIEIDSKCPEQEEFEFLRNKGFKVKTMKLSKFNAISQGLALPVAVFPVLAGITEGSDVTDILGITYSNPEDTARKNTAFESAVMSMKARHQKFFKNKFIKWVMKHEFGRKFIFFFLGKRKDKPKEFPSFVSKTDEERCENQPWRLNDGKEYLASEKLDGTSSTFALKRKGKKFEFFVCSRNVRQKDENQSCYHDHNIYWDMAFKYDIEKHLREFLKANPNCEWVCIQGESVGSVQGNPLKLKEDDLYIFNFIDSVNGRRDSREGKKNN